MRLLVVRKRRSDRLREGESPTGMICCASRASSAKRGMKATFQVRQVTLLSSPRNRRGQAGVCWSSGRCRNRKWAPRRAWQAIPQGNNANPNGRPPKSANLTLSERTANRHLLHEVRQLARDIGPDDINTLIVIRDDETAPHSARIMAANSLLDRGFGRPGQAIEASFNATIVRAELSPLDEINRRIAALVERERENELPKPVQ